MTDPLSLLSAVRLARELHSKFQFPVSSRNFQYSDQYAVDNTTGAISVIKVATLQEHAVDPINSLYNEVCSKRGITIQIRYVDIRNNVPALSFMSSASSAVVLVQRNASRCVRRFGIVKELLHLYSPDYAVEDTSGMALARAISAAMRSDIPDIAHVEDALHPERFCSFLSVELMLPWGPHGEVRRKLTDSHEEGATEHMMACMFRVPLSVMQRFFAQGYYVGLSHKLNTSRV